MLFDEKENVGIIGNPEAENFIKVSISEFKNKKYIDIRKMWNKDNEIIPLKKGISIPFDNINELISILKNIGNNVN